MTVQLFLQKSEKLYIHVMWSSPRSRLKIRIFFFRLSNKTFKTFFLGNLLTSQNISFQSCKRSCLWMILWFNPCSYKRHAINIKLLTGFMYSYSETYPWATYPREFFLSLLTARSHQAYATKRKDRSDSSVSPYLSALQPPTPAWRLCLFRMSATPIGRGRRVSVAWQYIGATLLRKSCLSRTLIWIQMSAKIGDI